MNKLKSVTARIARKGFVGPRYRGLAGKVRFAFESTVARQELLLVNTPDSFRAVRPPPAAGVTLHRFAEFADLAPFAEQVDEAYYPGYADAWRAPFSWGERGVLAMVNGRAAGVIWLQYGVDSGFPTYWGRLYAGECRFLREGVFPPYRGRGINSAMNYQLLQRVFDEEGITRVYAEVYKNNIPSLKSLVRVGFQVSAVMTILELPPLRSFMHWSPASNVAELLGKYGIRVDGDVKC